MSPEQHGDVPLHNAGSLGRGVLEIYPAQSQVPITITFGLVVESVEKFRESWLSAGGQLGEHEQMVIDPDGNSVFLALLS